MDGIGYIYLVRTDVVAVVNSRWDERKEENLWHQHKSGIVKDAGGDDREYNNNNNNNNYYFTLRSFVYELIQHVTKDCQGMRE